MSLPWYLSSEAGEHVVDGISFLLLLALGGGGGAPLRCLLGPALQ